MIYNTGETEEELKANYNPEGSVLRKAQLRMLDMLIYIDKVCKEQNIEYSLDGGNVLGAIRHGGFIPWDDDIDIVLRRSEYDRLCKYLLEHPHPQYVLQTPDTDRYFSFHWNVFRDTKSEFLQDNKLIKWRKYRGLQIDIFPIEKNVNHQLKYIVRFFHKCITIGLVKRVPRFGMYLFKFERAFTLPFVRYISRFLFPNNKKYSYAYGLKWHNEFSEDVIYPVRDIQFEGYTFKGPNKPIEYLKELYGNYMDLPPKDKRHHHKATYKVY